MVRFHEIGHVFFAADIAAKRHCRSAGSPDVLRNVLACIDFPGRHHHPCAMLGEALADRAADAA
jgi:hypothetical protein